MKYLTKNNKPNRINNNQLNKYFHARSEGLSYNENYNEKVLGISSLLYKWIDVAINQNYGSLVDRHNIRLSVLNQWFQDDIHTFDEHGRLLNYLGIPYKI